MGTPIKNYDVAAVGPDVGLGKNGPRAKAVGTDQVAIRNSTDTGYARVKGADPIDDSDLVTKKFLLTRSDITINGQINGGAPPAVVNGNMYIVTTAGGAYVEGALYYGELDAFTLIGKQDGTAIKIADNLVGGNITFTGEHVYLWDADTTTWKDVGPVQETAGVTKIATYNINHDDAASVNILEVQGGGRVIRANIEITEVFDGGGFFEVTKADGTTKLVEQSDYDEESLGQYNVNVGVKIPLVDVLRILMTPAASTKGTAVLVIEYALA